MGNRRMSKKARAEKKAKNSTPWQPDVSSSNVNSAIASVYSVIVPQMEAEGEDPKDFNLFKKRLEDLKEKFLNDEKPDASTLLYIIAIEQEIANLTLTLETLGTDEAGKIIRAMDEAKKLKSNGEIEEVEEEEYDTTLGIIEPTNETVEAGDGTDDFEDPMVPEWVREIEVEVRFNEPELSDEEVEEKVNAIREDIFNGNVKIVDEEGDEIDPKIIQQARVYSLGITSEPSAFPGAGIISVDKKSKLELSLDNIDFDDLPDGVTLQTSGVSEMFQHKTSQLPPSVIGDEVIDVFDLS